jgi:hypothetical protein
VTRRFVFCCLAFALLAGGCAATLENYKAKSPDEAQVLTTLMRIPNGIRARSVDTLLLAYADDAYIGNFHKNLGMANPGGRTTLKKQDLRAVYTDRGPGLHGVAHQDRRRSARQAGGSHAQRRVVAPAAYPLRLENQGRDLPVRWILRQTAGEESKHFPGKFGGAILPFSPPSRPTQDPPPR